MITPPLMANWRKRYFFFAAFFFEPFAAFFAISNPPLRWLESARMSPCPAHSAAWHVGPGGASRFVAHSRPVTRERGKLKKNGVLHLSEHPESLQKNYRFFAAFFFEPLAAFFAIVFSSGCATQPPTVRLAVTTGGLSHPPSYQM